MFVFYYFIKQSTLLLNTDQLSRWRTLIKYVTICSAVAYICYASYFIIDLIFNRNGKYFCHTWSFILGGTLQLGLTSVFLAFSQKLKSVVDF